MKVGDKLVIIQNYGGLPRLQFVDGNNKSHKIFTLGDAVEAVKYLLLDEEGRKSKNV